MKFTLPVIALLFIHLAGLSQKELNFHHYTLVDGLSNNVVNCILQDSYGFIWIGTDEGLNRFDGREFKHFVYDRSDSTSIGSNKVYDLAEDDQGNLWIATFGGGLNCYRRNENRFVRYSFNCDGIDSAAWNNALDVSVRNRDEVWVGFEAAPLVQIPFGAEPIYYAVDSINFFRNRYYSVFTSRDQELYLGQFVYGLMRYSDEKFEFENRQDEFPYPGSIITTIFEDDKGLIWHGGWDNGLHVYDPESDQLWTELHLGDDSITYSGEEIQAISQHDGYIWIGTRFGGLWTYHPGTGALYQHTNSGIDPNSISSNSIRSMIRDSEGRIWVGTNNGLSVFDPKRRQFDVIYMNGSAVGSRTDEYVKCFYEDEEGLRVGTTKGLWENVKNHNSWQFNPLEFEGEELQVHSMLKLRGGEWLLGTNRSVMRWGEERKLKLLNTIHIPSLSTQTVFFKLISSRVTSMQLGRSGGRGILFAATYGYGLSLIDTSSWSGFMSLYYNSTEFQQKVQLEPLIRKLHLDAQGRLWVIGSSEGLMCGLKVVDETAFSNGFMNKGYATTVSDIDVSAPLVYHDVEVAHLLPSRTDAFDLIELNDGGFVCSTYGSGLWLIESDLKSSRQLPSLHTSLEGMALDSLGRLWVIASGGFDVYDFQSETWHRFDYRDGFPVNGVSGYFFIDSEGRFYAGGSGYFVRFNPLNIQVNSVKPGIVLTGFSVLNEDAESRIQEGGVHLEYDQNDLAFRFAALNFTNPEMNQYAFRLLGYEEEWVQNGTNNFARYPRLPAGDYVFQVKASNNHGVWNEDYLSIPVVIRPPFWERTWFVILLVVCVAALVIVFYYMRLRHLRLAQLNQLRTEINAQEKERKRLAGDLHDELGVKMSTLKLYLNTIHQITSKDPKLGAAGQTAQNLVDESIAELRNLLQNLSPQNVSRFGVFRSVRELALRLECAGSLDIEYSYSVKHERFDPEAELAMYRIIQELINNTIKHAGSTRIVMSIAELQNVYVLDYADDGIGLKSDSAVSSGGMGLRSIENRIHIVGGSIEWNVHPEFAFSVRLNFPAHSDGL